MKNFKISFAISLLTALVCHSHGRTTSRGSELKMSPKYARDEGKLADAYEVDPPVENLRQLKNTIPSPTAPHYFQALIAPTGPTAAAAITLGAKVPPKENYITKDHNILIFQLVMMFISGVLVSYVILVTGYLLKNKFTKHQVYPIQSGLRSPRTSRHISRVNGYKSNRHTGRKFKDGSYSRINERPSPQVMLASHMRLQSNNIVPYSDLSPQQHPLDMRHPQSPKLNVLSARSQRY